MNILIKTSKKEKFLERMRALYKAYDLDVDDDLHFSAFGIDLWYLIYINTNIIPKEVARTIITMCNKDGTVLW